MLKQKKPAHKLRITGRAAVAGLAALAAGVASGPSSAAADASGFRFPVALCVFTQWKLTDSGGKLDVKADDYSPEHAYRVEDIQAFNTRADSGRMLRVVSGAFDGEYDVPSSPYRVRFEGKIQQGVEDGQTDTMRVRSYLEKRDPQSGSYQPEGQLTTTVPARANPDGTVWENVPAYAFNSVEMKPFMTDGKPDSQKIITAVRDGKLDIGSVFAAGPVCGLLDAVTAKKITANRDKLRDIFDRVPDVEPAQKHELAQAPVLTPPQADANPDTRDDTRPDTRDDDAVADTGSDADAEVAADSPDPAAPTAQDDLADDGEQTPAPVPPRTAQQQQQLDMLNQERLADAQARAYNTLTQQQAAAVEAGGARNAYEDGQPDPADAAAQPSDMPMDDGRDPAASGMPPSPLQPATPDAPAQTQEQVNDQLNQIQQQQAALGQQQDALLQRQQELAAAAQAQANTAVGQGGSQPATAPAPQGPTGSAF